MKRSVPRILVSLALLAFLTSCLTINIYFPVAEVEKTAEKIVDDVYGQKKEETPPDKKDDSSLLDWLDLLGPRRAHADEVTTVSNAAITALKNQIAANHSQLIPFYNGGQVGITQLGSLEIRSTSGLNLQQVATLRKLVEADNQARTRLYQEVATALNLQAEQVPKVRQIFANEWRNKAQGGWWIQSDSGSWQKK